MCVYQSAATIPKKRQQAPVTDSSLPKAASHEQDAATLRSFETFMHEFLVRVDNKFDPLRALK